VSSITSTARALQARLVELGADLDDYAPLPGEWIERYVVERHPFSLPAVYLEFLSMWPFKELPWGGRTSAPLVRLPSSVRLGGGEWGWPGDVGWYGGQENVDPMVELGLIPADFQFVHFAQQDDSNLYMNARDSSIWYDTIGAAIGPVQVASSLADYLEDELVLALRDDVCLLYTSPSPRDRTRARMPSSA